MNLIAESYIDTLNYIELDKSRRNYEKKINLLIEKFILINDILKKNNFLYRADNIVEYLASIKSDLKLLDELSKTDSMEAKLKKVNELDINVTTINEELDKILALIDEEKIKHMQERYNDALNDEDTKSVLGTLINYLTSLNINKEEPNIVDLILNAFKELGYTEKDEDITKYAAELDELNIYNGKKQGNSWCDIFVDWCFIKTFGKENALKLLNQNNGRKYGAGTAYSAAYYTKGLWENLKFIVNENTITSARIGDQIFFGNSNGDITHTGIVVAVVDDYVYTVEGNSLPQTGVVIPDGKGAYLKRFKKTSDKIKYYGRPNYSNNQYPLKESEEFLISSLVEKIYKTIYSKTEEKLINENFEKNKKIENPYSRKMIFSTQRLVSVMRKVIEDLNYRRKQAI